MSDIKLVSEEYTSRFITGPELQTELSKKQDNVGFYINGDGNVAVDCGISQGNLLSENHFGGTTYFYGGVEIQGKNPVLDVTSSDGSITVTREASGDGVDLKTNGGPKWIKENTSEISGWITIGESQDDSPADYITLGKNGALRSIFVSGPLCSQHREPLRLHGYDELDIRLENYTLTLNQDSLKKLKDLLDNADLLLALLHN